MYSFAHPPLAPPRDMQARLFLQPFAARGIPAGVPLDTDLLMEAAREHHFREAALGHMNLTEYKVMQSQLRLHRIENEHIASLYNGGQIETVAAAAQQGIAPNNDALGLIRDQLQAINSNITSQFQAIKDRLQAIEGQLQGIIGDTTDIRNMQRRAVNHRVVQPDGALRALTPQVTRYGQDGNGIAGIEPFRPPAGVALGGEIPSPPFPAPYAAIDMMSMQQIHALAVYAQ